MADRLTVALSVDALGPRLTGLGRYCLGRRFISGDP
jgi:hypothetical protein